MSRIIKTKKGFTLIELMLALVFVAALLVMVAAVVIQVSKIYNRGILLRTANESAQKVMDSLRSDITASLAFNLDGSHYVHDKNGGRLCTGRYSYVWNYANGDFYNKYSSNHSSERIRLVRINDPGANYCTTINSNLSDIDYSKSSELLGATGTELYLYEFDISSEDSAYDSTTGQRIYNINFRLGTDVEGTLDGLNCKAPSSVGSDLTYCYINSFNLVVRAGGDNN